MMRSMSYCPPTAGKRRTQSEQDEYENVMRSIRAKYAQRVSEISVAIEKSLAELESVDTKMRDEAIAAGYTGKIGHDTDLSFAGAIAYGLADCPALGNIREFADVLYETATDIIVNTDGVADNEADAAAADIIENADGVADNEAEAAADDIIENADGVVDNKAEATDIEAKPTTDS
jgi:hypothetical protein